MFPVLRQPVAVPPPRLVLATSLMGHPVDDVIKSHSEGHGCERFRVVWIICPFPRVSQVHVVADGDDNASLIVANSAPLRLVPVFLVGASGPDVLLPRNLHFIVYVIQRMKYLVSALEVLD